MKHLYLKFYFLTIFALICCIPTISADALIKSGDLYYILDISTGTARVTDSQKDYNGYYVSGDLVIPENVDFNGITFSVTKIDNDAFRDCSRLTSVTIPGSVTTIGHDVFSNCSKLASVTLADGEETLSIDNEFKDCPLSQVYLGRNLSYRNNSPFEDKKSIQTVTIGNSVTKIGYKAFSGCKGLTSIAISNSVTLIDTYAFQNCNGLTSATIGNSVTKICNDAFRGCKNLTSLTIADGEEALSIENAFADCPLSQVYLGRDLSTTPFKGNTTIQAVTIGNSVKTIGYHAFSGCTGLTSITIPDSVTEIDDFAFCDCKGLTSATIGNSVTRIGIEAFYNCIGLTSMTIPNSVTKIDSYAFSGCKGLTSLTIGISVNTISYCAFSSCTGLTSITIPNSVTTIYDCAFGYCSSLASVTLADGDKTLLIENAEVGDAFKNCPLSQVYIGRNLSYYYTSPFKEKKSIQAVTIGNSVTEISDHTFEDCANLTLVTIGNSVKTIGEYAFSECTGLTSITIPDSVTTIDSYAFSGCTGFTSVTIPNSVTEIDSNAFSNCSNLASVTLADGEDALSIGSAFADCPLAQVYIGRNLSTASFKGNTTIQTITIGNSVTEISDHTFEDCANLTLVTIGNSVKTIGEYAFSECTGLTSITIPDSVTTIDSYAFSGCTGFTSVTIPNSVTEIDSNAFSNCSNLASVTLADGEDALSIGNAFADCPLAQVYIGRNLSTASFKGNTTIQTITIGNSVTEISDHTFEDCANLTLITIGNSVKTIGEYAFSGCTGLTSITIPDSVTTIDSYAFSGCTGFTSVTIPNSVTEIDSEAFSNCSNLASVTLADGEDALSIGNAFADCPLAQVYIGRNLSTTPFKGNTTIQTITIGNSVTKIGVDAFSNCSNLASVTIADGEETLSIDNAFKDSPLSQVYIGRNLSTTPFKGNTTIQTIIIGNLVTEIGVDAFSNCTSLTSVTIGNSVTEIDSNAFSNCSNLASVTLADGEDALSIGNAFADCPLAQVYIGRNLSTTPFKGNTTIQTITIGNSVTEIGVDAFTNVYFQKAIWLTNTPPDGASNINAKINYVLNDQYSFSNQKVYPFLNSKFEVDNIVYVPASQTDRTCDVIDCNYYPSSKLITIGRTVSNQDVEFLVRDINPYAFYNNDFIAEITINNQGSIREYAFAECSNTKTLTIGQGVNEIGVDAFSNCSNLASVTIADGEETLSIDNAFKDSPLSQVYLGRNLSTTPFKGNTTIQTITIGNSVTEIGDFAFSYCTSLTSVTISDGEETLSIDNAFKDSPLSQVYLGRNLSTTPFKGNTTIQTITIGNSVTEIGVDAFGNCSNLASVTIADGEDALSIENAFADCPLTQVYIGRNLSTTPFKGNTTIKTITIGNSVTTIGSEAFRNCKNLVSVTIADGKNALSIENAFVDCPLAQVYIGRNLSTTLFKDFTTIQSVTIGNLVTKIGFDAFTKIHFKKAIWLTNTPPDGARNIDAEINYVLKNLYGFYTETVVNPFLNSKFEVDNVVYVPVSQTDRTCDVIDCNYYPSSKLITIGRTVSNQDVEFHVRDINPYAFYNNDFIAEITINNQGSIRGHAFAECSNTKTLTIGQGVTEIGVAAFSDCKSLTSVTIGNSVELISRYAFENCYVLTSITIPNSVTTIGHFAFGHCYGLTSITIPNSVTGIGEWAFSESGLTSAIIGNSVTWIADLAFSYCTGLTSLVSLSTIPPVCGDGVFYGFDNSKCILYVPKESIDDYRQVQPWKSFRYIKEVTSTGVDNIVIDGAELEIKITAAGIKIDNADQKPVEIYAIDGKLWKYYSSYQGEVIDLEHGFYIIRVGSISKMIKF